MAAAKHFSQQAVDVVGSVPERVTTDGHTSYPRAILETMDSDVLHRKNKYLNNGLEQDYRGINQRYSPMRGFGTFEAAARFCCAFDELRNYFRLRRTTGGWVSLQNNDRLFTNDLLSYRHVCKQPHSETSEEMDVQDSSGGLPFSQF